MKCVITVANYKKAGFKMTMAGNTAGAVPSCYRNCLILRFCIMAPSW